MRKTTISCSVLGASLALALSTLSAQAQATRTWVSGVGDDVNPCSRTAPCKTFAGAISKTAASGEINCLDPGGFGGVTITKNLTIACDYTEGGILASLTNGVTVNAAGIIVVLRGLDIEGAGNGLIGVNVVNAASVHIDKSVIHGFRGGSAIGVRVNVPTAVTTEVVITNTFIAENGISGTSGGVIVNAAGTGVAKVSVDNSVISNNTVGVRVDGNGSTGGIKTSLTRNLISNNTNGGVAALSLGAVTATLVDSNTVVGNATGLQSDGGQSFMLIGRNTVTQNGTGLSLTTGGIMNTYGNNQVNTNSPGGDGTPTLPALAFK